MSTRNQETVVDAKTKNTKFVNAIIKGLQGMKNALNKGTPEGEESKFGPELAKLDETIAHLKAFSAEFKALDATNTRKTNAGTKNGFSRPQYAVDVIAKFVNEYGQLPKELLLRTTGPNNYTLLNRPTLTRFFTMYHHLYMDKSKEPDSKGMSYTDKNMDKLFLTEIPASASSKYHGMNFYEAMISSIKEKQSKPGFNHKSANRAQYLPENADGRKIVPYAFNNAAQQVLVVPFFINGYTPIKYQEHLEKLDQIREHFVTLTNENAAKAV